MKKFFVLFFLSICLMQVFATGPSLSSLTPISNPAYKGDAVTITSVSASDTGGILNFDTNVLASIGVDEDEWGCSKFDVNATADLNSAALCALQPGFSGTFSPPNRARLYEYTAAKQAGALLAESSTVFDTGVTCSGNNNVYEFTDFDDSIVLIEGGSYFFCAINDGNNFSWLGAVGAVDTNEYHCDDIIDPQSPAGWDCQNGASDFDLDDYHFIYYSRKSKIKLKCGTETGVNYDDCISENSAFTNPFCSFTNTFDEGTLNTIYCIAEDQNTLAISTEVSYDQNTHLGALPSWLSITPISNIGSYTIDKNEVSFIPSNKTLGIQFRADSNASNSRNFAIKIKNNRTDGWRYFIYEGQESDYDSGIWYFNDSTTFGSGTDGIQKLWNFAGQTYFYTQTDTLSANGHKYYRMAYREPFGNWSSLNLDYQTDWDIALNPSRTDFNNHLVDIYSVSAFSNMRNQYRTELPDINSNANGNFLMSFTGYASANVTIALGQELNEADSTVNYTLLPETNQTTFTVATGADYPLMKTSAASFFQLYLSDYALIQRGFFVEPLTIADKFGNDLQARLLNGVSTKIIREGEQYRIRTKIKDTDGKLDFFEGTVYVDSVAEANKIAYYYMDANLGTNANYDMDWLVDGVVDLAGQANRDLLIVVRATSTDTNWFEIQTDLIKMTQFPSYPSDFSINGQVIGKKIGEHPTIFTQIETIAPEVLRGVTVYIYDENQSVSATDFNKTYFKDSDFSCNAFNCSFDDLLEEYVWARAGLWRVTFSALLTTKNENQTDLLTAKTVYLRVAYKEFETLRVFESVERGTTTGDDHNYERTEEIPLVLQARDSDWGNMKNDLAIRLRLHSCDAVSGNPCTEQDINFLPTSFLYEPETGYNYWYFRDIYINDDGTLLTDGKYYSFRVHVDDAAEKHQQEEVALLSMKCQVRDTDCTDFQCFIPNALSGLNHFLFGCTTPQKKKVTTNDNNANELRLGIGTDFNLAEPTVEGMACLNTDNNNNFRDNLEQELYCAVWYTFNEAPIDNFKVYLTNENSDLSKEGNNKQFLEVEFPFELVVMNDLMLMKKGLEVSFNTDPLDTVGDIFFHGMNEIFVGIANPLTNWTADTFANQSGIIKNVGYDANFSKALDTDNIDGMLFFKIKGIKVLNKQDFLPSNPDLNGIPEKDFLSYLNWKEIPYTTPKTTIEFYASDMKKVYSKELDSPLVIDVPYSDTAFRAGSDESESSDFETLPTELKFNVIFDLVHSNEAGTLRRYVSLIIKAIITPETGCLSLECIYGFVIGAIRDNIFIIVFGLVVVLIVSVIVKNLKSGGGQSSTIYFEGG